MYSSTITSKFAGRNMERTYTGNKGFRKIKKPPLPNSPDPMLSDKFRVGPTPQSACKFYIKQVRAQQFSAFGPSRSQNAIFARNNFFNGQPQSIPQTENFNAFLKKLSQNNVKPRSPDEQELPKKSRFCNCKELIQITKETAPDNVSINVDMSPGLFNTSGSKQNSPTMKGYLSSKKDIYRINKKDILLKKEIYKSALQKILKADDEDELKDFDHRYLRSVRQRKLVSTIKFLMQKSKQEQISLLELIEHRMTQYKAFQTEGSYSFLYYVKKGFIEKVEQMLKQNGQFSFDFDEKQMTGLHIAAQKNNIEMMKLLLAYKSNPMSLDLAGKTPLHYALYHHNAEGVRLILNLKCPSDLQYSQYCKSTEDVYFLRLLRKAKMEELIIRCPKIKQFIEKMM